MFGFGNSDSNVFDPAGDIPDLSGKVILVTGGNSGLGAASIRALALHNPQRIYLACRTLSTGEAVRASIQETTPDAAIEILELDLGSFESVKKAADRVKEKEKRLDILLLNAGIAYTSAALTESGYEHQFGTNHMGHALLTKLLMPVLLSTISQPNTDVRVVFVSSAAHRIPATGGIDFESLKTSMSSTLSPWRYGQSKLANLLFSLSLSQRYTKLKCVSCHPGAVATPITRGAGASLPRKAMAADWIIKRVFVTPDVGAKNQLWCCTSKEANSGEYYDPVGKIGTKGTWASDEELAKQLWEWTEAEMKEKGFGGWP